MVAGVAFPPASRKLAFSPFKRSMVSFVAIASPAPLTKSTNITKVCTNCADIPLSLSQLIHTRADSAPPQEAPLALHVEKALVVDMLQTRRQIQRCVETT